MTNTQLAQALINKLTSPVKDRSSSGQVQTGPQRVQVDLRKVGQIRALRKRSIPERENVQEVQEPNKNGKRQRKLWTPKPLTQTEKDLRERRIKEKFEWSYQELISILTNEEVRRMFFEDFKNTIKNCWYQHELPKQPTFQTSSSTSLEGTPTKAKKRKGLRVSFNAVVEERTVVVDKWSQTVKTNPTIKKSLKDAPLRKPAKLMTRTQKRERAERRARRLAAKRLELQRQQNVMMTPQKENRKVNEYQHMRQGVVFPGPKQQQWSTPQPQRKSDLAGLMNLRLGGGIGQSGRGGGGMDIEPVQFTGHSTPQLHHPRVRQSWSQEVQQVKRQPSKSESTTSGDMYLDQLASMYLDLTKSRQSRL